MVRCHIEHPACRCDVCSVRRYDSDEVRDVSAPAHYTPHVLLRMAAYACASALTYAGQLPRAAKEGER